MQEPQQRVLLEDFVSTYLWADDDWLEWTTMGFTYWQARLPQVFTATQRDDGSIKWRAQVPVVTDIQRPELAENLCLELNEYTAGWTFAYESHHRSIHALAALTAPITWRKAMLRFAESAKLAAWFCDLLAPGLANAVSGRPCFSHPTAQATVRAEPDAVNAYATVLRSRPEWIFDPTPYTYPEIGDVAETFHIAMGATADKVEVVDEEARFTTFDASGQEVSDIVSCSFDIHPLLGMGWRSEMTFPWVPDDMCGSVASAASWAAFSDDRSTVLGSWVSSIDGGISFRQWSLTSELRGYEQLPGYGTPMHGTHDAQELWEITSTLTFAAQQIVPMDLDELTASATCKEPESLVEAILAEFSNQAAPALASIPTPDSDWADRRLLWLKRKEVLLVCGWFNPSGPTLDTVELCQSPYDADVDLLVLYRRHPLLPKYRVMAAVRDDDELLTALPAALREVIGGSLPNFLTISQCPSNLVDSVTSFLADSVTRAQRNHDIDLLRDIEMVRSTMGDPWAWASIRGDSGTQMSWEFEEDGKTFDIWLDTVSDSRNLNANLMQFPDPWDGSLNFQASYNNLGSPHFDVGPFVVIYSSIGRIDPDEGA